MLRRVMIWARRALRYLACRVLSVSVIRRGTFHKPKMRMDPARSSQRSQTPDNRMWSATRRACCSPLILTRPRYTLRRNDIQTRAKRLLRPCGYGLFSAGSSGLSYESFLPELSFPIIRRRSNANATGALFFLFFSAFGFFFSRLLLNWPFATLSSFACGECGL